jgi:hypothetical protein
MKKVLILFVAVLLSTVTIAQDNLFLVFEMMDVDNDQESAYWDTEDFWEKIHQQRVNNDEIIGWDLWQLLPGGEDQGYQYATVTLFKDKVSMFKGGGDLWENAKAAYPNMTEEDLNKKLNSAGDTRDLAVRIYMEEIATTTGDFELKVGSVAFFDFMKVEMGNYAAYEKAEMEVFQPSHQKQVDAGNKGSWSLIRYVLPVGSDTYASHMTVNMFNDVDQAFASNTGGNMETTPEQQIAVEKGLALRDMKMVTMARLVKLVRKQ